MPIIKKSVHIIDYEAKKFTTEIYPAILTNI